MFKYSICLLILAIILPMGTVLARDKDVNMTVQVVPRQFWQTINDFDLSSINTPSVPQKQVLGASTANLSKKSVLNQMNSWSSLQIRYFLKTLQTFYFMDF